MNIFRVPLNILVVAGTTAGDHLPTHMSFALIVHWSVALCCLFRVDVAGASIPAP